MKKYHNGNPIPLPIGSKFILLTMKLSFVLTLLTTMHVSASIFSQDSKLDISVKEMSVKGVLKVVESKSSYRFFYSDDFQALDKTVSVSLQNSSIEKVMDALLIRTSATYKILDNHIIVISPYSLQLQKVTGKVTDAVTGEPLIGVSISIESTTIGAISDNEGKYTIEAPNENSVLIISYIGYLNENIKIGAQSYIDIKLSPDIKNLEEVVVVGYGKQKKSDLTGAVVSANLKDFSESPNTNVIQSLQGTVPGLNVGQVTSAGATPTIAIRGANTLNGNTNVLIILDGIQYNSSLSSINPDDIASVDVLKDASSTAVYGAQAANGVLLITTKKGTNNQKPKITFSSSYTTQTPTVGLKPMNKEEYLNKIRDLNWDKSYLTDGTLNPNYNLIADVDGSMKLNTTTLLPNDFDWWKAGTHDGFIADNQLSITGGGEKVNYLISVATTDQAGFIRNDNFKRKSVRVNLESQATKWWKVGVQSFASFVNQDGAEPDLSQLVYGSPLLVPFDANGNLIPNPFNTVDQNPFLGYYVNDYERHNTLFMNLYSEIDLPFIKGLKYRFNYGNNYRIDKHYFASQYAAGLIGEAYKEDNQYDDYTFDNILTYDRTFGEHSLTATLLYGAVQRENSYTKADATGFTRLTLGYNSLESGTTQFTTSDAWDEALNYQMGRLNYKFADKYLLTTTIRRDGYSGFSANNKYAYFPSFALGWIMTEESFLKVKWLDFLKLRAGYGVSGNQTNRYKSLATVGTTNAYVFGDGGSTAIGQELNSLSNSDLRWEKTDGLNFGLDFKLFNSRLSGNIEWYKNTTKDLLFDVAIPNITGFSTVSTNVGQLQNKGFEFSLTSRNIDNKDLKWTTTIDFSTNSNKIVHLLGADTNKDGIEDNMVASSLFIGQPIGAVYDYKTNGIYQLSERDNGTIPSGYYPGTYRVLDQTGEGTITTDDRVILGHKEPAYRMGLLNRVEYKGFTLSIFINTIQGGKNGYLGANSPAVSKSDNTIRWNDFSEINYWSPGNPGGAYPRYLNTPTVLPTVYADRSFIRLQDVSLSYSFHGSFIKKLKIQELSLYVSGKNLATWTKWKGWDPEYTWYSTTNNTISPNPAENTKLNYDGYNVYGRPVMKGYCAGFTITF